MSDALLRLEARILWKSPRWFSWLKWPSAEEIDFGDFIALFDFKQSAVVLRYPDGREYQIATFESQAKRVSISSLVGAIETECYQVENSTPQLESGGSAHIVIDRKSDGRSDEVEVVKSETCNSSFRYKGLFLITPKVVRPDSFLSIEYAEDAFELAVLSACLLMFQRFTQA